MAKRGFTLIELLVVIAIIVILAALLFPVFAAARESARQSVCGTYLQEIGTAHRLYADDWDGVYPLTGNSAIQAPSGDLDTVTLGIYIPHRGQGVWTCPSDPVEQSRVAILASSYFEDFNFFGTENGCDPGQGRTMGSVSRRSETIMVTEGVAGIWPYYAPDTLSTMNTMRLNHNASSPVPFFTGTWR